MAEPSGGPPEWKPRSTGIVEALIGAGVGFSLLPGVVLGWEHFFHREPPEWAKGAVPNLLAAVVLIPAIWLLAKSTRRWRDRRRRATPKPKGDRISIYVAHFGEDETSRTARESVMASIRKELGSELVEVLPAGVRLTLSEDVSLDQAAEEASESARTLLKKKGGDLLIWGRVHTIASKSVLELRFVSADNDGGEGQRFGFDEKLTLEAAFGTEVGAALAGVAGAMAALASENDGRFIARTLIPLADRVAPLARSLPAFMSPFHRATLLRSFGLLQFVIGVQRSDSARLLQAVAVYRAALDEQARERVPLDWARAQNNLGVALSSLGERESGTERLEEAVAAYRAALEEWKRERVPLDWARTQNNLGSALSRLGERESGTERLEEAVAAYRAALEELTLERSSHYHRIALANFVRTDGLLGARIAKENNKHPAR